MARGIDVVLEELEGGIFDVKIGFDGDLETEDSFDTALIVSLFTDARANSADVPDPSRRRGWIGNEHTPEFEMGGTLWVHLEQGRMTGSTMRKIEDAARGALQWLLDEDLITAITNVVVEGSIDRVTLNLTIERSPGRTERRHFTLWSNTGLNR